MTMKSFNKACELCGSRVSTNSRSKKCGKCVRMIKNLRDRAREYLRR